MIHLARVLFFSSFWLLPGLFIAIAPDAQEAVSDHASLEQRLRTAEAKLDELQKDAVSVEEQIDSLDEQVALVSQALVAAESIEKSLHSDIRAIEQRVRRKEILLREIESTARTVAIELYKGGPMQELDRLLGEESLAELDKALAIAEIAAEERATVMVAAGRIAENLDADREVLRERLKEVKAFTAKRRSKLQHLRELRSAQTQKLSKLRDVITAQRLEAASVGARSKEISSLLSTEVQPTTAGSSDLMWPISGSITSGYGPRWGRMHSGIDIDCDTGATIRASKGGSVVTAAYDDGYGYHIVIDHGGGMATLYAHNSDLFVSAGGSVSQGEPIAACGSTGQSTGDHLHFEVRVNGSPVDPMGYLP